VTGEAYEVTAPKDLSGMNGKQPLRAASNMNAKKAARMKVAIGELLESLTKEVKVR
jgi:hypothetical protein